MQLIQHSCLTENQIPRSVITVGNFDGVHRGHRALLRRVIARAKELGAASVVYTFRPHPLKVLNPARCPAMITAFEERVALLGAEGIDVTVWARFDRAYASLEPEVFVRHTLKVCLGAVEVWVGPDFAFGRGRSGSIDLLRAVGRQVGFAVQVLRPFTLGDQVVSSTRVREAIVDGEFRCAKQLLGRPYGLKGTVVHGHGRGRDLGFPTANVLPRQDCIPKPGVYAAWVVCEGDTHPAAVNIGTNPTFGAAEVTVEAHLLDGNRDLYGKEVEVVFVAPVRGEIAFRSPADLVRQIRADVATVRRVLGAVAPVIQGGPG
ncbi:MAG: bifunctional riboflavin kinase/FAD synthetase [Deferrisomatales bacterium]|nr:bifunctional riboflavin kinase/FAD synthetase [Deferrisomatales bacterium]